MQVQTIKQKDYSVLLVDDDAYTVSDDEEQLSKSGYKVYTALSGEQALEIAKANHIDILVIDYYMGGISGEETIAKIREFDPEMVIILQTGFVQQQPALRVLSSLKIQGYYDKSEGREKLLIWVMAATRACEQQRELKRMMQRVEMAHYTLRQMKQDQARLIEQVRLASLGQKMGSIFHDMSNPLIAIQAGLENVVTELDDVVQYSEEAETKDMLASKLKDVYCKLRGKCEVCKKRIKYIVDMRNTVVAQSRQESLNLYERFTLRKMLETVLFFAEDDIKRYRCAINIDNQMDPNTQICGKEVSLVQVLNNIITNSAQAYGRDGKINITIRQSGDYVEFVVQDWAGGIPKEVRDKLLNEMTTTKGTDGNGIGLYTSYITVTNYFGGAMRFETTEGQGTTFYILIPLAVN